MLRLLVAVTACWLVACGSDENGGSSTGGTSSSGGTAGESGSSNGGSAGSSSGTGGSSSGGSAGSSGGDGGSANGGSAGSSGGDGGSANGGSAGSSSGAGGSSAGASGTGSRCGEIGSSCAATCAEGLECYRGLCVPEGRPSCGGFNPIPCPESNPNCLYCSGCDFGDCFTDEELACVCNAPGVSDAYDDCS